MLLSLSNKKLLNKNHVLKTHLDVSINRCLDFIFYSAEI